MSQRSQPKPPSATVRVACGLLALWIFVLSMAGASPAFHAWLHADSAASCAHTCDSATEDAPATQGAEGHYCGVIALQGAEAPVIVTAVPERSEFRRMLFAAIHERIATTTPKHSRQARAPPIGIVV